MSKLKVKKSIHLLLNSKEDREKKIPATLGAFINGVQRVKVPGRNGYVYARIRGNNSEVIQAFNQEVNTIYGLPVLLKKEGKRYTVIGRDTLRYSGWGGSSGFANLAPHGSQHSFGSGYGAGRDVVWVYKRQFIPLLVRPHTGTVVAVEEEWYLWNENYKHFTGTYVDIGSAVPGAVGDAKFLTLYLDGVTNSVKILTGSSFMDDPFPENLDNYIPVAHYSVGIPLAGVLLTHSTSEINWTDIYDIRPLFVGRPGSSSAGNLLIYDDGIFKVTGTAVSFDDNLSVFFTGSVAYIKGRTPEITILEDGAYKTTGTAIDFTDGLDVSVSGTRATVKSHVTIRKNSGANVGSRPRINLSEGAGIGITVADDGVDNELDVTLTMTGSVGGGGTSLMLFQSGEMKSSGTATIDFQSGFSLVGSGTAAFINLSLTGTSTYMRAGTPTALDGITGTYWRVPGGIYATGTLAVFVQGVAQQPVTDFTEQYPLSGTYQFSYRPPTGAFHTAIWGTLVPNITNNQIYNQAIIGLVNGRLTLTTGTPVTTSDVSAVSTLYFTPYKGNRITLFNAALVPSELEFTEVSLSLATGSSGYNYDIFAYNNNGSVTLESTQWSNDTTRSIALMIYRGVYVKSTDATRLYLGTIRMSAAGQCTDSIAKRFVWNYYNRISRLLYCEELTSHTYNGAVRLWNNSSTNNSLEFIVGIIDNAMSADVRVGLKSANSNNYAVVSLYVNAALLSGGDTPWVGVTYEPNLCYLGTAYKWLPSLGYSIAQVYETANATATYTGVRAEIELLG